MSNLTKEKFNKSISGDDFVYKKYEKQKDHLLYKIFYVEGEEDQRFYKSFLSQVYYEEELSVINCDGRDGVMKIYKMFDRIKDGFIVDLDYLEIDKSEYDKLIITTGYSMENFYFYKKNNVFNFEILFDHFYKDKHESSNKLKKYLKELQKFKNKYLYFYAFFKTEIELSSKYDYYCSHRNIKERIQNSENVESLICKEISDLDDKIKSKFIKKYEENKKLLNDTEYMLIRGHDLFDHLIDFLKRDKNIDREEIFSLSVKMEIPDEFRNQLLIKV